MINRLITIANGKKESAQMPHSSEENLVIHRSEWREGDLALLCGVANAGGGSIIISPNMSSHTKKMKHFRKFFESIPHASQQALGISCTTEPIMDGMELCLEIQIPAAQTPIKYRNEYYLYSDGINAIVTKDLIKRLFFTEERSRQDQAVKDQDISNPHTQALAADRSDEAAENTAPDPHKPKEHVSYTHDPTRKPTFKERSIAAANRLDMTSTDEYILKVLETNGRVTAVRIAEVLGISESTVRRSFRRLRVYGLIERIGSNKAGYWRVAD